MAYKTSISQAYKPCAALASQQVAVRAAAEVSRFAEAMALGCLHRASYSCTGHKVSTSFLKALSIFKPSMDLPRRNPSNWLYFDDLSVTL